MLSTNHVDSSNENANTSFQHDFPFCCSYYSLIEDNTIVKNKEQEQDQINSEKKKKQENLKQEKIIKTSQNSWQCVLCNKSFLSILKVKMHANRYSCEGIKKTGPPYKDTSCDECGIIYQNRKTM